MFGLSMQKVCFHNRPWPQTQWSPRSGFH